MPRKTDVQTSPETVIRRRISDSELELAGCSPFLPKPQEKFCYFSDDQRDACFRLIVLVGEAHLFFGRRMELVEKVTRDRALGAIDHVKGEISRFTQMFVDTLEGVRTGDTTFDVATIRTGCVFRFRLKVFALGLAIELSRITFDKIDTRRLFAHNVRLSEMDSVLMEGARQSPELFPISLVEYWRSNVVSPYRSLLLTQPYAKSRFLARMRHQAVSIHKHCE